MPSQIQKRIQELKLAEAESKVGKVSLKGHCSKCHDKVVDLASVSCVLCNIKYHDVCIGVQTGEKQDLPIV